MIREFELEHDEPTVELCAAGIAFFLAYGWHAEPRIKGKGEASLEGYVRFQDSHLTIGLLPRVLNCECHTYRTCVSPAHTSHCAAGSTYTEVPGAAPCPALRRAVHLGTKVVSHK